MTTKTLPSFCGPREGDTCDFKFEHIEHRLGKGLNEIMETDETMGLFRLIVTRDDNRLDIWNWKTREGQDLCKAIRKLKGLAEECDPKDNFYFWFSYLHFDEWNKGDGKSFDWSII